MKTEINGGRADRKLSALKYEKNKFISVCVIF